MRFRITAAEVGRRLDVVVQGHLPGASLRRVRELFARGAVRIEGRPAKKGQSACEGLEIELTARPPAEEELRPVPDVDAGRALRILHQDAALVAVLKPAGVPSHPLRAGEPGTLASALAARFPECLRAGGDAREAGLCNRLDVGASGVLVAARSRAAWEALRGSFRAGKVEKTYLAVGVGDPAWSVTTIDAPLAHDTRDPRRVVVASVAEGARPARTDLEVLGRGRQGERALVALRARTRTGRMHQVRVHCSEAGVPLWGDTLYGGPPRKPDDGLQGFALHGASMSLPHPAGGTITIEVVAPPAFARLFKAAGGPGDRQL